jgi:hypothetical protein
MKTFGKFINEYLEEGYLTEKNKPTSPEKWAQAKAAAKSKFAVYPSAYANAWAAKKYKSMGGGWKSVSEEVEIEEGAFSSGALKPSQKALDAISKTPSSGTVRDKDEKGVYTAKTVNGKEVSRSYEKSVKEEVEQIEEISEGLADDFAKMAKEKGYNARVVTSAQKKRETRTLLQKRAEKAKNSPPSAPRPAQPEKYPLGGYDPVSHRSYSEEVELEETAAWQRKEGKNPSGGLNQKGVDSYRREHPGSKLKTAVTTKPSKLKPGSAAANRRKSFCARMSGMKKRLTSAKTARDPDSRINKSLRKWNC